MSAKDTVTLNPPAQPEMGLNDGLPSPDDDSFHPQAPHDQTNEQDIQFQVTQKFLQNDDVFQTPIQPGVVPTLDEDTTLLAAAVEDLKELIGIIQSSHGMTRSYAQEAERIVPGVMKVPMGYFTTELSQTRYKVSLEGLFSKVWEFILEALRKVREGIRRVLYWIIGKKAPKKDASAAELQRANNEQRKSEEAFDRLCDSILDELTAAAKKTENVVRGGVEVKDQGQVKQVSVLDTLLEQVLDARTGSAEAKRMHEFMHGENALFSDFIKNGRYLKEMQFASQQLIIVSDGLVQRVHLLDATLANLILAKPGEIAVDTPTKQVDLITSALSIHADGQNYSLKDYTARVKAAAVAQESKGEILDFVTVFERLSKAHRSAQLDKMAEHVAIASNNLITADDDLRTVIAQFETHKQNHQVETNIDWNQVVARLSEEIAAMGVILSEIRLYRERLKRMIYQAVMFGHEVAVAAERVFTNNEMNEQARKIVRELADEAKHGKDDLIKAMQD